MVRSRIDLNTILRQTSASKQQKKTFNNTNGNANNNNKNQSFRSSLGSVQNLCITWVFLYFFLLRILKCDFPRATGKINDWHATSCSPVHNSPVIIYVLYSVFANLSFVLVLNCAIKSLYNFGKRVDFWPANSLIYLLFFAHTYTHKNSLSLCFTLLCRPLNLILQVFLVVVQFERIVLHIRLVAMTTTTTSVAMDGIALLNEELMQVQKRKKKTRPC